ncbi:hypothetical protein K426_11770 [Sphingobium sp. TKS]|nr:hypothetical protein K426_11770 [Sphingobium sp. TKS]
MRRARLETTAYGDLQPPAHGEIAPPEKPSPAREAGRDDRWVIRRSALSRQLVLEAQSFFENGLQRSVSESEARNLLGNLGDYMWILVKWEVGPFEPGPEKTLGRQRGPSRKVRRPEIASRPRGRPRKTPKPDSD